MGAVYGLVAKATKVKDTPKKVTENEVENTSPEVMENEVENTSPKKGKK